MSAEFVHLHNHSDYSLLDGAQTVQTLVNTIDDLKMDSVALTEHGNMFSVVPYYKSAKKAGVKPIIGCEIYVAHGSRFDKKPRAEGGWGNNHLILLAQNFAGYRNLMKLVTIGYLEGFYYRPRIDKELLKEHSAGLICSSGCLKGEVPEKLLAGDWEGAKATALEFAEMFPGRYYLEIQNHGIDAEVRNVELITKLARELDLPLVATNDAHYAKHEHWEAHDIHICLGTGKERDDPNRLRYATPEFYFKTQDDMYKLFKDYPDALENTRKIADSIDLELPMGKYHLPTFPIPEDAPSQNPNEYLRYLCDEGVRNIYGDITTDLQGRLDHELDVIQKMGFAGYFLITMDFVKYAKDNGIPVGPGRGSAAGSLTSYALNITTIDPMKHNLLFERFLNPERVSLPDIDIDVPGKKRDVIIEYLKDRYGHGNVSQMITFGRLQGRSAIKEVLRISEACSFSEMNEITKSLPNEADISDQLQEMDVEDRSIIRWSLINNPEELRDFCFINEQNELDGDYAKFFDQAIRMEGTFKSQGKHPAGVVISREKLSKVCPMVDQKSGDEKIAGLEMSDLESLGHVKFDVLGINLLDKIMKIQDIVEETHNGD